MIAYLLTEWVSYIPFVCIHMSFRCFWLQWSIAVYSVLFHKVHYDYCSWFNAANLASATRLMQYSQSAHNHHLRLFFPSLQSCSHLSSSLLLITVFVFVQCAVFSFLSSHLVITCLINHLLHTKLNVTVHTSITPICFIVQSNHHWPNTILNDKWLRYTTSACMLLIYIYLFKIFTHHSFISMLGYILPRYCSVTHEDTTEIDVSILR